jgi:hypothetical protein
MRTASVNPAWFAWLIATAAGAIVLSLAAKAALFSQIGWRCPVMALAHVPCPSCGSTRAFAALAEGQFLLALSFNPFMIAGLPFLALAFIWRDRLAAHTGLLWSVFAGAVFLNWLYLVYFLPR